MVDGKLSLVTGNTMKIRLYSLPNIGEQIHECIY